MSDTDANLVERVRQHDTAALAAFIESRRPQLLAFIERQLGAALRRKIEPDDLVQEVHVDCLRALPEVDLSQRDPFGWLCQMAERRIIDAHRHYFGSLKRAADREVPIGAQANETGRAGLASLLAASMTSPSAAFSRDQRGQLLLDAMARLPDDSREALRLRYAESLSSKEIAARLGKTDGAVRVLLTRSLKRLEELLGPDAAPRF